MRIIIRSRMRINPDISPESRCMRLISPYHELLKSAFLVHSTTAVGFLFNWHFPPDITRGQTGTSTGIPKKYQVGFAECDTGRMPFPSPNQSVKSLKDRVPYGSVYTQFKFGTQVLYGNCYGGHAVLRSNKSEAPHTAHSAWVSHNHGRALNVLQLRKMP